MEVTNGWGGVRGGEGYRLLVSLERELPVWVSVNLARFSLDKNGEDN